jgi:hypothetical protein
MSFIDTTHNLLKDCILNHIQTGSWQKTREKDKEITNVQCFPFDINIGTPFSYIKVSIEKFSPNNICKYRGIIVIESSIPFLRTPNDDPPDDLDLQNQRTFYTSYHPKLLKVIEHTLKTLKKISLCRSCNNIIDTNDKTCQTCAIQLFIQKEKTECCICMDHEDTLLPYRLSCDHSFHFACLTKMKNKSCPLCRKEFSLNE